MFEYLYSTPTSAKQAEDQIEFFKNIEYYYTNPKTEEQSYAQESFFNGSSKSEEMKDEYFGDFEGFNRPPEPEKTDNALSSCKNAYNFLCELSEEKLGRNKKSFKSDLKKITDSKDPGYERMKKISRRRYRYKRCSMAVCQVLLEMTSDILKRGCVMKRLGKKRAYDCTICSRSVPLYYSLPPTDVKFKLLRKALRNYHEF